MANRQRRTNRFAMHRDGVFEVSPRKRIHLTTSLRKALVAVRLPLTHVQISANTQSYSVAAATTYPLDTLAFTGR